jgi:hypothetical protein
MAEDVRQALPMDFAHPPKRNRERERLKSEWHDQTKVSLLLGWREKSEPSANGRCCFSFPNRSRSRRRARSRPLVVAGSKLVAMGDDVRTKEALPLDFVHPPKKTEDEHENENEND